MELFCTRIIYLTSVLNLFRSYAIFFIGNSDIITLHLNLTLFEISEYPKNTYKNER